MKSPVRKAASSFPSRTAFPIWTGMIPSWSCTRAAWLTTVLRKPCCITSAFPRWRRFTRSSRIVKALPGAGPEQAPGFLLFPSGTGKGEEILSGERRIRCRPSCGGGEGGASGESGTEREKAVEENIPEVPGFFTQFFVCWGGAGASFSATVPSWFFNWSWCCCFPCW